MATNIFHDITALLTFSMTHEVSWKMVIAPRGPTVVFNWSVIKGSSSRIE